MRKAIIVDMFAGAGGESTGLRQALEEAGVPYVIHAINHWFRALETLQVNHPDTLLYNESIEDLDPRKVIPGGRVDWLHASPSCRQHSTARTGPKDLRDRAHADQIIRWASDLDIPRITVENVVQFLQWGPCDQNGHPIKERKGELYDKWVSDLEALGYTVEHRIICCADLGAPTTRERLFIQAAKNGLPIRWPDPTHSKNGAGGLIPWIPASECIDWSIPGKSIFNRKKPLAPKTLARIERGIEKYWGEWAEPFLVILRGQSTTREAGQPMPTVTSGGIHVGVVSPLILGQHSCSAARDDGQPVPTVATAGAVSLIQPLIMGKHRTDTPRPTDDNSVPTVTTKGAPMVIQPLIMGKHRTNPARPAEDNPTPTVTTCSAPTLIQPFIVSLGQTSSDRLRPVDDPLRTVVSKQEHSLVEPFLVKFYGTANSEPIDEPLDTVTTKERFGLVEEYQLDITFRMLQPRELARAQAFPDDYVFLGNKAEQTKQIGNAVPPVVPRAIARQYTEELKGWLQDA